MNQSIVDVTGPIVAVFAGVMTWSFLEYTLHRFLGHDKRTMPNFFSGEHTRHHSEGNYFAPGIKKAGAAILATVLTVPTAVFLAGPTLGILYSTAFVAMYMTYELFHRRAHTHPGFTAYGRALRRHHFHHHFGNPKSNHGVTSSLWDHVFGTYEVSDKIRVPERLAMVWLTDDNGDVKPRFAAHYSIQRLKKKAENQRVDERVDDRPATAEHHAPPPERTNHGLDEIPVATRA